MNDSKSSGSGLRPACQPETSTQSNDAKGASANNNKATDAIFVLEKTFPKLDGLLQSHEFPSLKSSDVIVALDTNTLLLPFEITSADLGSLEQVYHRLQNEGRLIVPGRVLREFANLRDRKLADVINALNQRKGKQSFELPLKLIDRKKARQVADAEKELQAAKKKYDEAIGSIVEGIRAWRGSDPVTSMYHRIFREDSVVDLPYGKEENDKYLAEFRWRVGAKVPPGYKDKGKDDEGVGDFLIWKTLLKVGEEKKSNLAFVTGEEKGDWYTRGDQTRVFPRIELLDEYRRISGGKLLRLLSLHELLRELDVEEVVVDEVERAEQTANTEIRASRLAPGADQVTCSRTTYFQLAPGSSAYFMDDHEDALFSMRRARPGEVSIFALPPAIIYPFGKFIPGVVKLPLDGVASYDKVEIRHEDGAVIRTGKGTCVGIRFNLEHLASNDWVIATWVVFPDGAALVLP